MSLSPADIAWTDFENPSTDPAHDLTVRWLGTAGYEFRCQGTTVLIDPYFSRIPLSQLLFKKAFIKQDVIERFITDADAIIVGHSHFDHVMDVPAIAQMTGATVYGSESTSNLCAASGLTPEKIVTLPVRGLEFDVGPFRITAVPSEHSRFMFGRIPFEGDVPCSCELPMPGKSYRCGQVFNYHIQVGKRRIFHLGSANLIDDVFKSKDVDLVLLCAAGRHPTKNLAERVIRQVEPQRIIPMHYDNFFRSFDVDMKLLPLIKLASLVDEIAEVDTQIGVQTLELMQRITLDV